MVCVWVSVRDALLVDIQRIGVT